jgi:hypothetical protein
VIFLILAFCTSLQAADKDPVNYPQVLSYRGLTQIQSGTEAAFRKPKLKEVLREKARIKAEEGGQIEIAVDADRALTVQSGSEVDIPAISWETGHLTEIDLENGQILWQQTQPGSNQIQIKSPVFDIVAPKAVIGLSYNPEKVRAEAKVYVGSLEFSALNAETSEVLTAGKSVVFEGIKEDGEVAYDVLLKGRKIPKGHLLKVENLSSQEMAQYLPEVMAQRKKDDIKRIQTEKAKKEALLPGQICRHPGAKLNECVWNCQNNPKSQKNDCLANKPGVSCIRRRCNANGLWEEETTLDSGSGMLKCKAKPVVAACDY